MPCSQDAVTKQDSSVFDGSICMTKVTKFNQLELANDREAWGNFEVEEQNISGAIAQIPGFMF
jgi:hypothetical protein